MLLHPGMAAGILKYDFLGNMKPDGVLFNLINNQLLLYFISNAGVLYLCYLSLVDKTL